MTFARTKIQPPRPRSAYVERALVQAQLADALLNRRVVLLCAPAGYGKTTALAHEIAQLSPAHGVAWISADAGDDLQRLLECMLAALEPFDPPWRTAPESLVSRVGRAASEEQRTLAAEIINTQQTNETFRYLTGKYEVETLTLPRRTFSIDIQPNKTENILLPAPGVVNFNTTATGYGSLYTLADDGTQQWVCNLNELKPQFSLTLLPGQYKIVFRVKQTTGSKYTGFKKFGVRSGETVSVNVFK